MGALGMPVEAARDVRSSTRRLLQRLRGDRVGLVAVVLLAVRAWSMTVLGPLLLGRATDVVFRGLQDGGARDIDFAALRRVLLAVIVLYLMASTLQYLQSFLLAGIVQRTMYRLRADVEAKLNRLPLRYVDRQPRGDLLSRVSNDIDNISQSLQQTLSQLLTSLLSLTGTIVMMIVISPLLALVAIISIPISLWTMRTVTRRSKVRSSSSGATPAGSTRWSRSRSPATPSSRRSAASVRSRSASARRTRSCTRRASAPSSSPGSSSR
jgi:ATP-binding cassette subfamily B protein